MTRLHKAAKRFFSFFITFALFVISIPLFYKLTFYTHLDFTAHVNQTIQFLETGYWRPNFLYYFLIASLSLFSTSPAKLYMATTLVMALSIAFKYYVTEKVLSDLSTKTNQVTNVILPLCFIFLFSLPVAYNHWYFGQLPPNVWHNSTTIFLMPFAILLFWNSWKFAQTGLNKFFYFTLLFSLINILIKPSFVFCFIIIYPLWLWWKTGFSNRLLKGIIIVVISIFLILSQYAILYFYPESKEALSGNTGGVKVTLFHVWGKYSENIFISFLLSIPFPIAVLSKYHKAAFKSDLFLYALGLFLAGIMIFSVLTETGAREFHGNFMWQTVVCNYLFYLSCLVIFLQESQFIQNFPNKLMKQPTPDKLIILIFSIQFITGLGYLLRLFIRGSYS
ncbi:hypothetical protein [Flexithrix dorotheae]|uniref:hypothetical protein n=1 Tax=Flexithrix dorotheae TaxID=70993 RepID=UPI00036AC6C6|nr:hypothetical protein [Flexithrix dorotheae]